MSRWLGVGSWWSDDLTPDWKAREAMKVALAYVTRAQRCGDGWLVVRVKRFKSRQQVIR